MNEGTNSKSYDYFVPIDDIRPIKSLTVICPQHDEPDFDAKAFESNLNDMEKAYYDDIVIRRREAGGAYITFLSPGFNLKKLAKLINEQEYKNRFIHSDILKECYSGGEKDDCCPCDPNEERVGDDYICLLDFPRIWENYDYPYDGEIICKISSEYHHNAIWMLDNTQTEEERKDPSLPGISSYVYSRDERTSYVYLLSEDFDCLQEMREDIKTNYNRITPKILRKFLTAKKRIEKEIAKKPPIEWGTGCPFPGDDAVPCDTDGTGKIWKTERPEPGKITVTY